MDKDKIKNLFSKMPYVFKIINYLKKIIFVKNLFKKKSKKAINNLNVKNDLSSKHIWNFRYNFNSLVNLIKVYINIIYSLKRYF